MNTHLTLKSSNAKTGPIPVSTSPRASCPPECPFLGDCYGESGFRTRLHWDKVDSGERGTPYGDFLAKIKALPPLTLWRHNQTGDLAGVGSKVDARKLGQLTKANQGKRGYTYTHKPVISGVHARANAAAIEAANKGGFTINLSGNNPAHADRLANLGIAPVVTVVARETPDVSYTPQGRKIVVCPAQQRDDVTCASCGLCARQRSVIVGFRAHGVNAAKVEQISAGYEG